MRLIFFINFFIALVFVQSKILDTSNHILSRQKRWLIWNNGTNWVQFIFGIGIPLEVKQQSITVGTVMKAFYTLPTNSSVYTHPSIDYSRKTRSTSRWTLYQVLESYLERYNYDGKACLLKTICEFSHSPVDERSGILAEIVQAVLTPSVTDEITDNNIEYHSAEMLGKESKNCDALFPECRFNLMQQFTSFLS